MVLIMLSVLGTCCGSCIISSCISSLVMIIMKATGNKEKFGNTTVSHFVQSDKFLLLALMAIILSIFYFGKFR